MPTLRLGTRGSLLARSQSQLIATAIEKAHPDVTVELTIIKTTGDAVQDKPLAEIGGKGLFTKELELALLRSEIDLAVHSFKDVPVTMPLVDSTELVIAAVPKREDARDVLVTRGDVPIPLHDLPAGAKIGTGSVRRRCQLLDRRADLLIEPIRGNIDTRLRKLRDGEFDAIVLAMAGLMRAGLFDSSCMTPLEPDTLTPAAGQGALALQVRQNDISTRSVLEALHDPDVAQCVALEREVVRLLEGDCHSPIAAYAVREGDQIVLRTALGIGSAGYPVARAVASAPAGEANSLPVKSVEQLRKRSTV